MGLQRIIEIANDTKQMDLVQKLDEINYVLNTTNAPLVLPLVGEFSSGKTTLLSIISCLDRATEGNVFFEEKNINLINRLKELNINMNYLGNTVDNSNEKINGKTFVITGTLSNPRDYYKEKLESLGANVTGSVTKKTDYVLVGDNPGSKYEKAKELGITIINEEDYNNMIL